MLKVNWCQGTSAEQRVIFGSIVTITSKCCKTWQLMVSCYIDSPCHIAYIAQNIQSDMPHLDAVFWNLNPSHQHMYHRSHGRHIPYSISWCLLMTNLKKPIGIGGSIVLTGHKIQDIDAFFTLAKEKRDLSWPWSNYIRVYWLGRRCQPMNLHLLRALLYLCFLLSHGDIWPVR